MTDLLPVKDPVLVFALVALLILLAPIIMGRYRLPGMIGLLLAGAVLGPNALGVLARDQSFVLFGTVGLLYIMFTAALEIDMAVFKRYGVHTIAFGLLTFGVPLGTGVLLGLLFGFEWPAAILLGSVFSTHTLLAYPIASRLGIARNPAVTTTVGGTILTDTLALLVMAVIAGTTRGEMDEAFWYRLGIGLALYVALILLALPRLARWFFRNAGGDGVAEFVFVLAAVFGCASLAHLAGAEPIVGAFLAGLALNRLIPHNSTLMNRIRFTGEAVFVPFFLLSVGMLLDVRIFFGGMRAWVFSLALVATALATKWLAAHITRLLLGYSRDEGQVIFGLSGAHAAATLAITTVGYDIGLFDDTVVNGAILLILASCFVASWVVDRHGRRVAIAAEEEEMEPAGPPQRVLVALADPVSAPRLLELAQLVRDPAHGQPVYPLTVVEDDDGAGEQVARAEKLLSHAVHQLSAAEIPTQPLTRIDLNVADGVLRARRELRGTEIIIGWRERSAARELFFGSMIERLLRDRHYTLLVARLRGPLATCQRVVLAVPPNADHEHGFPVAVGIVKQLARQLGAPLLMIAEQADEARVRKRVQTIKPAVELKVQALDDWSGLTLAIGEGAALGDIVVLYGVRTGGLAWRSAQANLPARLAERLPATNLLVVYPAEPREEPAPEPIGVTAAVTA